MLVQFLGVEVNLVIAFVSAVIVFVIGATWYSPALFFNEWKKLVGLTDAVMNSRNMALMMGTTFLLNVFTAVVLSFVIGAANVPGFSKLAEAVLLSVLAWFSFSMPTDYMRMSFGPAPRKLFLIDASYTLVSYVAMGVVIGLFA